MTTPEKTPNTSTDRQEPTCDEEEFAQIAEELVADYAPRLFGLIAEEGERVDGHLIGWGMAFEDYVDVTMINRRRLHRFTSVDHAHRAFSRRGKIRLVWYNSGRRHPQRRGRLTPCRTTARQQRNSTRRSSRSMTRVITSTSRGDHQNSGSRDRR